MEKSGDAIGTVNYGGKKVSFIKILFLEIIFFFVKNGYGS